MIVLIPCYQPDGTLLDVVDGLRALDPAQRIVVVDDGSGPDYAGVFDAARDDGCHVTGYPHNRGKGAALKHGLAYVADHYPGETIVCADCDGQHTPADIRRVAGEAGRHPDSIVLGSRRFVGDVPHRSRYGNLITSAVFARLTGQALQDTQTGLRAYPPALVRWLLGLPGARYEYEMEILLAARQCGVPVVEVPIATVYIDGNRSSHIRLPWDLIRIYRRFVARRSSDDVHPAVLADTARR